METSTDCPQDHSRQMNTPEGWMCEDCSQVMDPTDGHMMNTLGSASLDTELIIVADRDRRFREQEAFDAEMDRLMRGVDR